VAYVFKPSGDLTDRVATAVRELRDRDPKLELSIARFYEYATKQFLDDYHCNPDDFLQRLQTYTTHHNNGHK